MSGKLSRQASSSHNQISLVLVSDFWSLFVKSEVKKQIGRRWHCLSCNDFYSSRELKTLACRLFDWKPPSKKRLLKISSRSQFSNFPAFMWFTFRIFKARKISKPNMLQELRGADRKIVKMFLFFSHLVFFLSPGLAVTPTILRWTYKSSIRRNATNM